ncbi:MAG: hypothetical protein GF310_09565 [candidate division Zixibacteria bacterium]|nr:hypothetical protein [candidate division Zixibacteria bacterium]
MAVEGRIKSFPELAEAIPDWNQWEVRQSLIHEKRGYQVEFEPERRPNAAVLSERNSLAVRNRHLAKTAEILKTNSLFLSGIYLPQGLWRGIFDQIGQGVSPKTIIYKENSSYLCITSQKTGFPKLKWYHQRKTDQEQPDISDKHLIGNVADNLANSISSAPGLSDMPVLVFEGVMDQDEISILQEKLGDNLGFIQPDKIQENIYSPGQIEYLMPYCAHKKISGFYISS